MKNAAKIMIVDDDSEIREIVCVLLESEGFTTLEAANGETALSVFSDDVDLVILDIMMAGMSGYQVCLKMRAESNVPILFLTAKNKDSDLTLGFSSGGDDYLAKPFSYAELLARVKGLLRRYQTYRGKGNIDNETPLEWRGIILYQDRNAVCKDGEELNLTDKEYQILRLLLTYRGRLFSAQNLFESIWEEPFYYSSSNTVMVHIRRLREKIEEDPQEPTLLKTVWGKGYRIE
ncbi:response regulator transcription factor [Acetobacterium sp. KB-1]|jgi:DNA-binding response OmpR family regulator|uniref:response regulator transcription factor n=1 Tax=Acetobacterium sp. KB-1 TaxID=2184575 RepID=UPI000DBEAFFB|nr:response regulator transcription factor [Acetobacterium sp. KB-1]AWW27205.1 DNA-binding response regulator [Acetobacterium sp. KB-1]